MTCTGYNERNRNGSLLLRRLLLATIKTITKIFKTLRAKQKIGVKDCLSQLAREGQVGTGRGQVGP